MSKHHFVRILCAELDIDMSVLAGAPAAITGGIGGWEAVPRADAVSITEWAGNDPVRQSVPILMNGLASEQGIQRQVNKIIQLGRQTDKDEVPPTFHLRGPVHFPQLTWVLEDVEFDSEETIRDEEQDLVRQEATLLCLEYVNPDQIQRTKKRKGKGHKGSAAAPGSTYITKQGDTLAKIAAKVYGDREFWKMIAKKNDLRDPNKALKPGTKLYLPLNPWV